MGAGVLGSSPEPRGVQLHQTRDLPLLLHRPAEPVRHRAILGCMPDGSSIPFPGQICGSMCMLGTFAERARLAAFGGEVDDWLPLETAVLVGCGVPSVGAPRSMPETCGPATPAIIYGVGGLGINAVRWWTQVAFKRETTLKFGATHAFADAASAAARSTNSPEAGRRRGADPVVNVRRRGEVLGRDRGDRQGAAPSSSPGWRTLAKLRVHVSPEPIWRCTRKRSRARCSVPAIRNTTSCGCTAPCLRRR